MLIVLEIYVNYGVHAQNGLLRRKTLLISYYYFACFYFMAEINANTRLRYRYRRLQQVYIAHQLTVIDNFYSCTSNFTVC